MNYQQGVATAEVDLSQWHVLQEKIRACSQEAAPSDAEVNTLLTSIFRDHVLADYPDFVKYFQNRSGKAMEERLLHKAAAAQHQLHQQQQPAQDAQRARGLGRRMLDGWLRFLARYRAWPPRVKLYLLLSCPEYSPLAVVFATFMMCAIILNTITFCMESVPSLDGTAMYDKLILIDYVCLGIFTVEFLLRLLTCNSLRSFARKLMNWIDLAAILPFLVELMVVGPEGQNASQTRIFRLIRLVRLLRLLRVSSRFRNLQIVVDALAGSLDVIAMLAVLLVVLLVVAGTVVYYVEGALVTNTWFDSIPLTMYYMQVTLTTVGYGDYYAQSTWGRFTVGCFMLLCMVTISLPIGVIGGNFSNLWSRFVALRDAIDRSVQAWATRAQLRVLAAKHCAAVDELITTANRLKASLEDGLPPDVEGINMLTDKLAGLQLKLQLAASDGENSPRMTALKEGISELRRKVWEAADRYGRLQGALALVSRVSSADLVSSLDGLHAVHQAMARRTEDGDRRAVRCRDLLADLRALREVVRAEEEEVYGLFDGTYEGGDAGGDAATAARKES